MKENHKKTSFKISAFNETLTKHIAGIHLSSGLDRVSELTVDLSTIKTKELPEKISLTYENKTQFQGHLLSVTNQKPGTTRVTYVDKSFLLKKHFSHVWLKENSLKAALDKTASLVGLATRFVGDFNDSFTAYSLVGKSLWDHLKSLSDEYGFYLFMLPQEETLVFLRSGSNLQDAKYQEKAGIIDLHLSQSAQCSVTECHLSLFDSMELQNHEKTIVPPAGSDPKKKWMTAKGSQDFYSQRSEDYQSLDARVRYRVSKMETQGEMAKVATFHPFTGLGDKMTLDGSLFPENLKGSYLTSQIQMDIQGNLPKFIISGVRK